MARIGWNTIPVPTFEGKKDLSKKKINTYSVKSEAKKFILEHLDSDIPKRKRRKLVNDIVELFDAFQHYSYVNNGYVPCGPVGLFYIRQRMITHKYDFVLKRGVDIDPIPSRKAMPTRMWVGAWSKAVKYLEKHPELKKKTDE